jgi:hypothetical protein
MPDSPVDPRPTVWVVNFAGHNYEAAEEYGRLDYLTQGYVSMGSLDRLVYTVSEAIADTHRDDYLLLSGLIALNALSAAVWLQKHKIMRLLLWDQKLRKYRPLVITLNQVDTLFDKLVIAKASED